MTELEVLQQVKRRLPKQLTWQEDYTPCANHTYNEALKEVNKVIRQMIKDLTFIQQ